MKVFHIVLVEDDDLDALNVQKAFTRAGVSVPLSRARNVEEALALLRGNQVPKNRRLIMLDLNLPGVSGIEFLKMLRADPELSVVPVVVLTTSNDDRDRRDAYLLNVAGYIVKPAVFAQFVERMLTMSRYWGMVELP